MEKKNNDKWKKENCNFYIVHKFFLRISTTQIIENGASNGKVMGSIPMVSMQKYEIKKIYF